MQDTILEIRNVSKKYGDFTALNTINLTIPKGKIFGLLGPNGAGKTSLIRIINQIILPDTGTILFDGEKLTAQHIKNVGYLPEERGLYKNMKVGEQALYLAQLKGLSKKEAEERLKYWFNRLQISNWWSKKISELSKGMAQKVQFIITVLHQPKLVILDEPFSGFDPLNAEIIKNEIIELKNEGISIIFSTHRMESVEEMCDEIALINHSQLILQGKVRDIRKLYKKNTFRLQFETYDQYKLSKFSSLIELQQATTFEDGSLELIVKNIDTEISLIHEALKIGHLSVFEELLPSVHDVFIESVQNKMY